MEAQRRDSLALKLHGTTDAEVWADEFMRINGAQLHEIDRYTMIAWFSNSIQTGVMHCQKKHAPVLRNFD